MCSALRITNQFANILYQIKRGKQVQWGSASFFFQLNWVVIFYHRTSWSKTKQQSVMKKLTYKLIDEEKII